MLIAGLIFPLRMVQAQAPVVRAVLFYSPTCPHCEYVITEVMPPLFEKYGDQLQVFAVNVQEPAGGDLFRAVMEAFALERAGVPLLVIGNQYLMGSVDIPEQFPGLVESYLAQGGVDWPAIGGIAELVAESQPAATADPSADQPADSSLAVDSSLSWRDAFTLDPVGNSLSVLVLAGMVVAVIWGFASLRRPARLIPVLPGWVFPVLSVAGLIVAVYLAYVEVAHVSAVCGPVGDCNTVQQSDYARLFGVPIGVLGVAGYILILLAWAVSRFGGGRLADYAALSLLVMTGGGVLFSVYLTFLEPFVIGATCAWCITSAVIMTLLFLLSLDPGKKAIRELTHSKRK
jgi:uncharacterized membrane protein